MLNNFSKERFAKMIDYTLLKPATTKEDIIKLCKEAKKYGFAAVCVNPIYVSLASSLLKNSKIKTCTVIGFPLGANKTQTKVFEAERTVMDGAQEIDMVMNLGMFKAGSYSFVREDIASVVKAVKPMGILVKVIIETCYLTHEEKIKACRIVEAAGADYVKTSTGLGGGATVADVRLIRSVVGGRLGVKASGGIRTLKRALAMVKAGATRIGTSSGVKIMEEFIRRNK